MKESLFKTQARTMVIALLATILIMGCFQKHTSKKQVLVNLIDTHIDTTTHVVSNDVLLGKKVLRHVGDTAIATIRIYVTGTWKVVDIDPCISCDRHRTTQTDGVQFNQTITTLVIRKQ